MGEVKDNIQECLHKDLQKEDKSTDLLVLTPSKHFLLNLYKVLFVMF